MVTEAVDQGSTKLLSLLSKIRETPKSLRNFFLERTSKKEKNMCVSDKLEFLWNFETQKQVSLTETCISHRNKFLLQKKKNSLTEKFSLTDTSFSPKTSFSHRNKFFSQKQVFLTETRFSHRNKFLLKKQVSHIETSFSHRNKFLSQKQVFLTESFSQYW